MVLSFTSFSVMSHTPAWTLGDKPKNESEEKYSSNYRLFFFWGGGGGLLRFIKFIPSSSPKLARHWSTFLPTTTKKFDEFGRAVNGLPDLSADDSSLSCT